MNDSRHSCPHAGSHVEISSLSYGYECGVGTESTRPEIVLLVLRKCITVAEPTGSAFLARSVLDRQQPWRLNAANQKVGLAIRPLMCSE